MEFTKEQISKALDEAYKKAGHNAYFANGFEAGVVFAQEQFKILNIPCVTNSAYFCKIWNGTTHWQECVIAVDMDEALAKVDEKYGKPMRTELLHKFDLL